MDQGLVGVPLLRLSSLYSCDPPGTNGHPPPVKRNFPVKGLYQETEDREGGYLGLTAQKNCFTQDVSRKGKSTKERSSVSRTDLVHFRIRDLISFPDT